MTRRWVAGPGGAKTIGEVLAELGEDPRGAVNEGRVFLGRRRVCSVEERAEPGDEVVVEELATDSVADIVVLGEFESVYVVSKPSGLPTEPDRHGGRSLVGWLAERISAHAGALHAATRLDTVVSGLVVVARGAEAARRVALWKERRQLLRRYVALCRGRLAAPSGAWDAPVGRGPRAEPRIGGRDARPARTRYSVVRVAEASPGFPVSLLVLEPDTGRTHQLRLHASHGGAPLLGDVRHGGPARVTLPDGRVLPLERAALHAGRVDLVEAGRRVWSVVCPPPADMETVWSAVGGHPGDLLAGLSAPWIDA